RSCNAALWLANQVGDLASYGSWTPLQKQQYYHWLTLANHNDPSALLPKKILVEVLRKSGDTQQAYQLLHSAADEDQEAAYMMAVLADEVGRREEAARRAQMLVRKYEDAIQRNPEDHESRLRWASLLVLAGDERKAIDALQEGLRRAADDKQKKQLRSAMVEAIVVSSKKLQQQDDSPSALLVSLRMLKEAMRIDATNVNLLEAISDACVRTTDSNNNQLEILRESLVQGVDPDTAHFILGTAALNQGNIQEATQHLEISIRNNPGLPGLLNNMACLILSEESPDLERALRLSEAALRSQPNHTYLRETRGQILFRMQRYTEAIADLEFALSSPELRKNIRHTLAEAYDALGQTEIAERQRELMSQRR
ncbi:MAG: tetratricopeptide repeat protein, partial [bacterium]|nr:tetratricopeptide repeat protein [bacterium]